ncbi:MAG: MFS transporter [Betaproteobacteria bacterium]|nr:MFS transporter [Betaproteobacteria bacterium]
MKERSAIAAVFLGNFVVGCGVLVVPGMLDLLAIDLAISVPKAGTLLSLAALTMCVGAPLLAAVTSKIDRRVLLVLSLMLLAVGHLACAFAPDFATLIWIRPVSVLGAAVFTPQAAATLSLMIAPEERPMALTSAFVGWSLASVLGMPIGNLLAHALSWRASFAVVAALGLLSALVVWRVIPAGLKVAPLSLKSWGAVLGGTRLRWILLATMVWCMGHFAVLGYITAALRKGLEASPAMQAILMALMGVSGLIGNVALSRWVTRIGADRGARMSLSFICAGLAMWVVALTWLQSLWAVALAMTIWGLGNFAFNSSQQARLAQSAPALASASIALNSSSLYAGQAIGAALGAALVVALGYDALGPTALIIMIVAMLFSWLADHRPARPKLTTA